MNKKIIIVGAGPAGLGAAQRLIQSRQNLDIKVLEKGKRAEDRNCCKSMYCNPCDLMNGIGGAGGFSDGKINLDERIGGRLATFNGGKSNLKELLFKVYEKMYRLHSSEDFFEIPFDQKTQDLLVQETSIKDVRYIPIIQRHIGTDKLGQIIFKLTKTLESEGVEFLTKTAVIKVQAENGIVTGVETKTGFLPADYVILCTGRTGSDLVTKVCADQNIEYTEREIDIGIRLEFPNSYFQPVLRAAYDPKFIVHLSPDEKVRTFCTNPSGFVVTERYNQFIGVNGHAYSDVKSKNTNVAILYTLKSSAESSNLLTFGQTIARQISKDTCNRAILQTYHDLKLKTTSTIKNLRVEPTLKNFVLGNVWDYYPEKVLKMLIEGVERLDSVIPGIASGDNLVYSPEIKYRTIKISLKDDFSCDVKGLYFAGDGSGHTGDIIHSSTMGWLIAEEIIKDA